MQGPVGNNRFVFKKLNLPCSPYITLPAIACSQHNTIMNQMFVYPAKVSISSHNLRQHFFIFHSITVGYCFTYTTKPHVRKVSYLYGRESIQLERQESNLYKCPKCG